MVVRRPNQAHTLGVRQLRELGGGRARGRGFRRRPRNSAARRLHESAAAAGRGRDPRARLMRRCRERACKRRDRYCSARLRPMQYLQAPL